MECIYCGCNLPDNAKFCPKCLRQIVCIDCGEVLFKDSSICISCGNPLKNIIHSNNNAVNNIEFIENENGKTFKASFTDTVAGNVVETFVQLLPLNNYSSKKHLQAAPNDNKTNDIVDIANAEVVESTQNLASSRINSITSDDQFNLEKIFKNKNGVLSIYDTRIKAANKKDFVARITLLFLYYKRILGVNEVERNELNTILNSEKLYDGGFRSWLSANRRLIDNKQNYLELRPEGIELAEKYLSDFLNTSIPNTWDLKNAKKNNSTKSDLKDSNTAINDKSKGKKSSTIKKSASESYSIDRDLNLHGGNGIPSFKDFYEVKKPSSTAEINALSIYYLKELMKMEVVTLNHVYTCYKEISKKPAIYFKQSFIDTKNKQGYIEYDENWSLSIPHRGVSFIEHNLPKQKKTK